jgi:hypothetical protein
MDVLGGNILPGFMLGLLYKNEDGGEILLRTVGFPRTERQSTFWGGGDISPQGSKPNPGCYLLNVGFMLGLLSENEDGGKILVRNIGSLSTGYMTIYPRSLFI